MSNNNQNKKGFDEDYLMETIDKLRDWIGNEVKRIQD